MERKEQEVTARNAELHRDKVGKLTTKNAGQENGESDVTEGWYKVHTYAFLSVIIILLNLLIFL